MKKIAFVIRLFQKDSFHGGGEKLFSNLIKRFASKDYEIDIYCSKADIEAAEGINKIIIIDRNYDHLKPETMENFYEEVVNYTKNKDYDFVISENISPPVDITFLQGHSLVNRLKRDKNPLESFLYNFRKVKIERIKFQKKWMEEGYRHIFVVSEILKKDIVENYGIAEDKISVIYPGVDIALSDFSQHTSGKKPITFGLAAPGFKIKGGFIFLKTLGLLKKQGYDFRAKIIYPKYQKNLGVKLLIKLLNIEKNVEFLPYQENIQNFYDSIDCLVAPSIEDTFNLAVLEAMANYKPCIVSTNAGASEIITDGKNGFIFDIRKKPAKNLSEKLIFYIENSGNHSKIAQNAFETAKYYSWDRTFVQFIDRLQQISSTNKSQK